MSIHQISIIIPVYNESESIDDLFSALFSALKDLKYPYEVVFVDDGSSDSSLKLLKEKSAELDKNVKIIAFRRNYGQTTALSAGIDHSEGDVIVLMDADLQNDPADIPMMLEKIEEGYDLVSGWRKDRKDNAFLKVIPSRIANWLISTFTNVNLHDYGCTLKAYRRDVLQGYRLYGEMHRFIPAYASFAGARICEVVVNHHPRKHGISNYGLERTFKVLLDLITVKYLIAFSQKPIYLFGGVGFGMIGLSILDFLFLTIRKFTLGTGILDSPLLSIGVLLFLVGINAVLMGLLAELMMRTYYEAQSKKTYILKETVNID